MFKRTTLEGWVRVVVVVVGCGDAGQRKIEMSNRNQRQILIDAGNHRDWSTLAVLTDQ